MSTSGGKKKSPLSGKKASGIKKFSTRSPPQTKKPQASKTPPPPKAPPFLFGTTSKGDKKEDCAVRVVVHVRPLIQTELEEGCEECLQVEAEKAQVECRKKRFGFDKVYGACAGSPAADLFRDYIQPLVDTLFKGYNATVLAYGPTRSGKTYTMGSAFTSGETARGVIPSVLDRIFERMHDNANVECTIKASFVEIYKEDIRDLLASDGNKSSLNRASTVNLREIASGGVCLAGATEREVRSKEEVRRLLALGTELRATAMTNPKSKSSRSHAVFTITLEQQKQVSEVNDVNEDCEDNAEEIREKAMEDDFLTAKMHLVDLAGSERLSKIKAEGERFQEEIDVNKGLLALGKVISSLVSNDPHVPYRDSKLTRLLQDSLGGNSKTVMIACVSPADIHMEETCNTLSYASQARNIKNEPKVNRDPVAAQLAHLYQQLAKQGEELAMYKNEENTGDLRIECRELDLRKELETLEEWCKLLEDDKCRLEIERDRAIEDARAAQAKHLELRSRYDKLKTQFKELHDSLDQSQSEGTKVPELKDKFSVYDNEDTIQSYLHRIEELESENLALREFKEVFSEDLLQPTAFSRGMKSTAAESSNTSTLFDCSSFGLYPELADLDCDLDAKQKEVVEEETYRLKQSILDEEVRRLEQHVESTQKQIRKVMVSSQDVEKLKQEYEEQVQTLESKKQKLEEEVKKLNQQLQDLKTQAQDEQRELEQEYQRQLKEKEEELKALEKQEEELAKLKELLKEADETRKRLTNDIEQMKAQKAQLTKQIAENEKKYTEKMDIKDKHVQWLEEQNQKHLRTIERKERIHNMQENSHRQKVMAGEEARSRLEVINRTARTPPIAKNRGTSNGTAKSTKVTPPTADDESRKEWLERELDTCNQGLILKTILDSEIEQRKHIARLLRETEDRLKDVKKCISRDPSCADRFSKHVETLQKRKQEYTEKKEKHSAQIEVFQTRCAEVESMEEKLGPRSETKRWTSGVKSLTDARELLRILFKFAGELKIQSHQYYVEKSRLEQEFAAIEEKLEASEYKIKDLTVKLGRAKTVLLLSANLGPKARTTNTNSDHTDGLLKKMKQVASTHDERDIADISSDSEDAPAAAASSLAPRSDFVDTNDAQLKNSPNGGLNSEPQSPTPKEKALIGSLGWLPARQQETSSQRLTASPTERNLEAQFSNMEQEKRERYSVKMNRRHMTLDLESLRQRTLESRTPTPFH